MLLFQTNEVGFKTSDQGLALVASVTVVEILGLQENVGEKAPIIPSGMAQRPVLRTPFFPCLPTPTPQPALLEQGCQHLQGYSLCTWAKFFTLTQRHLREINKDL